MKIASEALTKMTDDASPPLRLCRDYDDVQRRSGVGTTRRRRPHPLPGIDQTSKLGAHAGRRANFACADRSRRGSCTLLRSPRSLSAPIFETEICTCVLTFSLDR